MGPDDKLNEGEEEGKVLAALTDAIDSWVALAKPTRWDHEESTTRYMEQYGGKPCVFITRPHEKCQCKTQLFTLRRTKSLTWAELYEGIADEIVFVTTDLDEKQESVLRAALTRFEVFDSTFQLPLHVIVEAVEALVSCE